MLDLLAAIVSADPSALLAWLVLAFAAGMYPIGIMLGSTCSPCCARESCDCLAGELPETVTVNASGFQNGSTQGPDNISLAFASNFGSGASARVTAPGGNPGPISAVAVLNGGSGYARVARVAPTVTASVPGVAGASLQVILAASPDTRPGQIDRLKWSVGSVNVLGSGTGGASETGLVSFAVASGDTVVEHASAYFYMRYVQPVIAASVDGGTGAALSVTIAETLDPWTGVSNNRWAVQSVEVLSGGSGYAAETPVAITVNAGSQDEWYGPAQCVAFANEGGEITNVTVYDGGQYYRVDGIDRVEVSGAGGIYFREDPALPREPANVQITITQFAGNPSGGVLTPVIDTNPNSQTYGRITAITITNGGQGYLAWAYCESYLQGVSAVLTKSPADCFWSRADCGRGFGVRYRGPSLPPLVTLSSGTCTFNLVGDDVVSNCSSFSFTARDELGRVASVSSGGKQHPGCGTCSGSVSINGVAVPVNGHWTLVAKAARIVPNPCVPSPSFQQGIIQTFGWARAVAGCAGGKVGVSVSMGGAGVYRGCVQELIDDGSLWEAGYDGLVLGAQLPFSGDAYPDFAPANFALAGISASLDFGPVTGNKCVGEKFVLTFSGSSSCGIQGLEFLCAQSRPTITASISCGAEA